MYTSVWVCSHDRRRLWRSEQKLRELKLSMVVSLPVWVLRTLLRSLVMVACVPNAESSSAPSEHLILTGVCVGEGVGGRGGGGVRIRVHACAVEHVIACVQRFMLDVFFVEAS